MHAPLRTICWRLKFASLGVLLIDRMVCPAISSIIGMPILAPLVVSPGVTYTPSKIAAKSHSPITVQSVHRRVHVASRCVTLRLASPYP